MCYPSPTAEVVSKLLEHHVISMTQFPITNAGWSVMKLSSVPQREIHLVNLRFLSIDNGCMEVLLIIHSTQLDCSFPIAEKDWKSQVYRVIIISCLIKGILIQHHCQNIALYISEG